MLTVATSAASGNILIALLCHSKQFKLPKQMNTPSSASGIQCLQVTALELGLLWKVYTITA
jgi:hypothetical protein